MADAEARYLALQEKRYVRYAEEESESQRAPPIPKRKSFRAIQREFRAALTLDQSIAKGTSLRKSLWARPWTSPNQPPNQRLWQRAKKVELFDTFISHVWSTNWKLKFVSLLLQSCWILMLTLWVMVATTVFLLCFFDLLSLDWRYDAEALGETVQCQLGPWIVAFSMPSCLPLGPNESNEFFHVLSSCHECF